MKRLTNFLIFFLFALEINTQVIKVDINPTSQPKGSLMLSDVVGQVEYIPLETKNNCIVGNINYFDVSENYIAVYVYQTEEIFLFRRTGRFVTKIGRYGQGGTEYIELRGIFINELKKCVYVQDSRKLLMYDLSGKHLNTFSYNERISWIYAHYNNQFISGNISIRTNEDYFVYGIWDSNMKLLKQAVKGVPVELRGNRSSHVGIPISCYIYQGFPHLKESVLNDTIYLLNKNNEFIPKYIINCGRYGATLEMKGDAENFSKNQNNGRIIGGMCFFETPNFLLASYQYIDKWIPCYFDKKANKLLYFNSDEGIPDDYTGGIDFVFVSSFINAKQKNNELYSFLNAYDLLKIYDKQKKLTPKGPAASVQKVQSLLKNLDPEDNPVLIIAKIKE